jgi:hypothetical protein
VQRRAGFSRSGFYVGLTALLKIVFYRCPPAGDMRSPGGHTSLSTLVYGGLTLAAATGRPGLGRVSVIGAGGRADCGNCGFTSAARRSQPGRGWLGVSHRYDFFDSVQSPTPGGTEQKVWPLLVAAGALRELHADNTCTGLPVPPCALRLITNRHVSLPLARRSG